MKKLLSFLVILFLGVISSACVNTFAVHELNENAAKFSEKGDYKSAISRLEAAIDLDQNIYETRYNLAIAYIGADDCEKALENIEAAQKLSKDEKADVYYTKGVIKSCLADKIFNKKNDEGEIEKIEYKTPDELSGANEKYITYLTEANENFQKYLELNKNAPDFNEIKEAIEKNVSEIENIKNPSDNEEQN